MIALSRFGHVLRLLTAIYFQVVVLVLSVSFILIPALAGNAILKAAKSTSFYVWRALGWSLTVALAAVYIFYFSAAWFAGGRLDTFSLKSDVDPTTESCQCQPAPPAEKIGANAVGTVNTLSASRHA